MTTQATTLDYCLPIRTVVERLERTEDGLRGDVAALPWYDVRRRWMLTGAIAMLRLEREHLLNLSAAGQPFWHQMGITLRPDPKPDRWVGDKRGRA
jgi:hypothetical protein